MYDFFGVDFCSKEVYSITSFVAMLYAKTILDEGKIGIIEDHYPNISSDYRDIDKSLDYNVKEEILQIIKEVIEEDPTYNIIGNVYELLKKEIVKPAMALLGTGNNKIKGLDAIRQTQFFTDTYMTDFLLDRIFKIKEAEILNCSFVDPASGGGNMLLRAFDKLFSYFKEHTKFSDVDIVNNILERMIVGYDIDFKLSEIAAFILYVHASSYSPLKNSNNVYIYGGNQEDGKGFLAAQIQSNKINGITFKEKLDSIRSQNKTIVFLTNPPFMGKRDMDIQLKSYLQKVYPLCKGDMCFSFMYKILTCLKGSDLLAAVTQNGWLNLVTLKWLRYSLISTYHLYDCADLGSNAFEKINGDKTNVVLCIFGKKSKENSQTKSRFYNLRNEKYSDKVRKTTNPTPTTEINTEAFLKNTNYEYNYIFGDKECFIKNSHTYKNYGKCMQGSSTGDNKNMVKFIWETNNPDWNLASKGGGFSKWVGLNYYKVKWGRNGELLKENEGSALRNENMMNKTQLVYSDTGTLGLNVRIFLPGQVFIASGPGITVKKGSPWCHLAFLNSRAATYLIKVLNPKFTLSAGYIGMIPVPEGVLDDNDLENYAKECVRLKKSFLSSKLPNIEFIHQNYYINDGDFRFVDESISADLANQLLRFEYERKIDEKVLNAYDFTPVQIENYHKLTGGMYDSWSNRDFDIKELDEYIAKHINLNCMPICRRLNGFLVGTENLLEMMSFDYQIPAIKLADFLIEHIQELDKTRSIYQNDLLHKLILSLTGISNLSNIGKQIVIDITWLDSKFKKVLPGFYELFKVDVNKLDKLVKFHHKKSFMNKPILLSNE